VYQRLHPSRFDGGVSQLAATLCAYAGAEPRTPQAQTSARISRTRLVHALTAPHPASPAMPPRAVSRLPAPVRAGRPRPVGRVRGMSRLRLPSLGGGTRFGAARSGQRGVRPLSRHGATRPAAPDRAGLSAARHAVDRARPSRAARSWAARSRRALLPAAVAVPRRAPRSPPPAPAVRPALASWAGAQASWTRAQASARVGSPVRGPGRARSSADQGRDRAPGRPLPRESRRGPSRELPRHRTELARPARGRRPRGREGRQRPRSARSGAARRRAATPFARAAAKRRCGTPPGWRGESGPVPPRGSPSLVCP
jgi:hypothetical protein